MYKHIKVTENDKDKTIKQILKEHGILEYKKISVNKFNIMVEIENKQDKPEGDYLIIC
jgi:hypothetical protein